MDEVFEAYVEALRRRRRSPLTVKANVDALRRLDAWFGRQEIAVADLSLLACERYFADMLDDAAASTVRRHLAVVRAAYRYGIRHGLVTHDPTGDVRLPRLPDWEPATYSNDELRAVYAAICSEREEMAFFLLAFAGLRLCEASELSWQEVDFDHGQLKLVGKSGKLRLVPLHPVLVRVLREHKRHARPGWAHVVGTVHDRRLAHRTWVDTVGNLVRRAGVEVDGPSHAFRRTVATVMHEQGVRTAVIDRIMGWAPRTVRERHYVRIAPQVMREAILTLYRDDPICPHQLAPADEPDRRHDRPPDGFLASETSRLERLERELGLEAN
jgi:site-specific recombinase XerD